MQERIVGCFCNECVDPIFQCLKELESKCISSSIQWTPGSQIFHSNQKTIFSKKWFLKKIMHNLFLILLATNTIFIG